MRSSQAGTNSARAANVSLILPIAEGSRPSPQAVAQYRGILDDPAQDGAEVVNVVGDRMRSELLSRFGLNDVLKPRVWERATS